MKRKVRITPPSNNPFESNSMSTWMAQMGGTQMGSAQPTEEEHIYSIAAEMLSQGIEQDDVKKSLSENGFPAAKVNELVDSLVAYVDEQREMTEANYLEDEDTQEQLLAEEEAAAKEAMEDEATRNAMYNDMYYAESDPGYAEEDATMQDILMKFGGKVPTKKQFVKKSLQLKKKQEGGQEQTNKADDTFSQKRPLSDFVYSISNEAQQKADEEMFEQEYDNYFGVDNELDEAQWGGTRGERRMMRRANRMMRRMPAGFTPPGQMFPSQLNILNQSTLFPLANTLAGQMLTNLPVNTQLANIEVRRTGLFGKPKEYTMNFNTVQPSQVKQKEVVDQEKQNVKATQKEVAEKEKEKETTTASTDNKKVQEELVTADQITVGNKKATTVKGTSPKIKDVEGTTPQVKKDKWGRPEGSEWYGFDPNTNTFTTSAAQPAAMGANPLQNIGTAFTNWNNSPEAAAMVQAQKDKEAKNAAILEAMNPVERYLAELSMESNNQSKATSTKKDAWGRPEGSEWYGYDPNKSKGKNTSSNISKANSYLRTLDPFFQVGGYLDSANPELYKFISGGNEMIPFADESFMYNSKDTTDPYFAYGGLTKAQAGYWKDGKWVEGMYPGDEKELTTGSSTAETSKNPNRKRYDALKEIGYNVGDYREGIDYTKLNTQRNQTQQQVPTMYNPQIGAMYPPLFGGRGFRPPGRTIEYAGSWAQQQGAAFDPRTGKPITGLASSSAPISKIDVTKSSLFGKRPKEYTIYYGNQPTGQAPAGSFKSPGANQSQDEVRQYSGFQNVLAQIPGLSKFVNQPKGDYVPSEGFVSPATPASAATAPQEQMIPAPQFTDKELGIDQLVNVQPESFYNTPDNQAMLRNMAPNAPSAPEYSDADLGIDQMVDVQPEDLSQYRSSFYDVDKLPIRRPYTDEQRQTLQDFAPAMNSLNYSADLGDQNMYEAQDFELQRMQDMDRSANIYSDRLQAPWSDLEFIQQPGIEEEVPANTFLPSQTKVTSRTTPSRTPSPKRTTQKVTQQVNKPKVQTRVNDNQTTEPSIPSPEQVDRRNNPNVRQLTKKQQIALENQVEDWDEYINSGLDLQQYLYNKNTGKPIPKRKLSEKERRFREYQIEAARRSRINYGFQQGGYLSIAQAGVNTNSVNNQDDSQIPMLKPKSSQEVWAVTEPQIRESWGLGEKTDPELQYDPYAVTYKNKDMYNIDFERGVNQFNTGANMFLSALGERGDREREAQMFNNLTADNLYSSKTTQDRGNYDPNSGLFRQDEMGFKGVAQKGGSTYKEGTQTYMSAKQIADFIANGGEIEFI